MYAIRSYYACVGAPDSGASENAKKMGRRVAALAKALDGSGPVGERGA